MPGLAAILGRPVARLGLGTMMFGSWGNPDPVECRRIVDIALEAGIDLFDTADVYDRGVSEEILGAAIVGRRDRVVVATKVGNPMGPGPLERGLSRARILTSCDDSLRRLGIEHIDLYQLHRPDPAVPLLESIAAMDHLVEVGKIRAWGTSTFPVTTLAEIHRLCRAHGLTPPTSEQPPFSMLCRGIETDVVPHCSANAIDLLTWAPLNGGWLTGKYATPPTPDSRAAREADHFDHDDVDVRRRKSDLVAALADVARHTGLTLTELAVRFVLSQPAVTACLLGPRTVAQAEQLCAITPTVLPADVLTAIDSLVPPGVTVNPRDDG